jgi:predicted PurR-regulated permease PerM
VVLIPFVALLGIITKEAIEVGQSITPWVQEQISEPGALSKLKDHIPFFDAIVPYKEQIFQKAGQMVSSISGYLINSLSAATKGTVNFLFTLFILLYSMFYFLMDGDKLLFRILYYLPLKDHDERKLLDRFTSVTRATLKGTAVIGILQGGLSGIAFAIVGIQSSVFWGAIMAVLSIIPGIGTALVWAPAAIILAVSGHYGKAVFLTLFCALAVGSLDNFLRPWLVGKDTEMHDLLILLGTLGGIAMFGIVGIIIGPIIAALFVTVWQIYGEVFRDILPKVEGFRPDSGKRPSDSE